ncbi:MAG: ribosome biogenesis GTPase Der [Rikenellaceae bacterium]|nr:ribosome biogenesis GTPase Der [Rikenellaceae bacterium]
MGLVALVGRPNVGKSTLFNRLVGGRHAIVDDTAGTTRDRHYGKADWNGREFSVIDTGGYALGSDDIFEDEIRKQVLLAIDEADVILFLVEVSTGITDLDMAMADILRRSGKQVILVVNKVDNNNLEYGAAEFYALGLGDPYTISSMSGSGTGELLDAVVEALPDDSRAEEFEDLPRLTIVGRPNVGKSSLTNALLGVERNIVTPVSGTTRDSIMTRYNKFGMDFYLVDTAGLRKKTKVTESLEFFSVLRSIRAIETSDVCILMFDASQGVESQDMNIFNLIVRNKKGCVIVVNKWDLIEKGNNTMKEYREQIKRKLAPFNDIPIIFTSVLNKQRILDVLQTAIRVYQARTRRIPTSEFNDYILPIIEDTPPPTTKGKYIRIKYAMQLPSPTPSFAFFTNLPQYVKEPYKRFLENKIRERWDFEGVPLQLFFRQK